MREICRCCGHWPAEPAVGLITINGPGGVGKTRLALEIARGIADEGSIRVVFSPLFRARHGRVAACAEFERCSMEDLFAEYAAVRAATLALLLGLPVEMRTMFDSDGGWNALLQGFAQVAARR